MDCIKKGCITPTKDNPYAVSKAIIFDVVCEKLKGQYRKLIRYICPKCGEYWAEAQDVLSKKAAIEFNKVRAEKLKQARKEAKNNENIRSQAV